MVLLEYLEHLDQKVRGVPLERLDREVWLEILELKEDLALRGKREGLVTLVYQDLKETREKKV